MTEVKVYSTPTYPWCMKVKNFLKENNIEYDNIDVSTDEKARDDMIEKSGQMGVPVIEIDGTIIVGSDETKLKQA